MADGAELGYVEGQLKQAADSRRFSSLLAEENVLNHLLTKASEVQEEALERLEPADFTDADNLRIFEAMRKVAEDGGRIEAISVDNAFTQMYPDRAAALSKKLVEIMGWKPYGSGREADIGDHIHILKALSRRRSAIRAVDALAKGLRDPTVDVEDALSQLRDAESEMDDGGGLKWMSLNDVNINTFEYLEARQKGEIKSVPTGIKSLDGIIGGLFGGELTVVAARPSVGKSAFGLNIAMSAAKEGFKVGVVSCEMDDKGFGQRTLSRGSWVSGEKLRKAEISDEDWDRLAYAMTDMGDMTVDFAFNRGAKEGITVESVFQSVKRRARKGEIDLLVVDYIGIMRSRREFKEDRLRIAYISSELKRLSMVANIPVVALCQVNRMAHGRMPTMAELRDSGAVEQDADGIIFLHRPESHEDKSIHPSDVAGFYAMQESGSVYITIGVAKQRNGSIGQVNVMFDPSVMRYNEILRE